MLVAAFRKPPVILKSNAFSLNCGHVRDDKNFASQKGNYDAVFGEISRISKCFHSNIYSKQKLEK